MVKLASSDRGAGPYYWRFTPLERFLHLLVIISFFGLVITGTPLLFAHTGWARIFMKVLGGIHAAGIIHRICAVITFVYFFAHVTHVAVKLKRSRARGKFFWGPDSMVPQPKDLKDFGQSIKWFFGRSGRPEFDRFSYMDKLDYWGEFWGVAIIGGSGLLLWFPEIFARLFPGWIFNVASIVHGIEALLAAGVIFTVHFFNVNLRPEKFPVDVVMFTGRATVDYLREEHPLEYERLRSEGLLEERFAPPPSKSLYIASVTFGLGALSVGLLLIGLILWALMFGAA